MEKIKIGQIVNAVALKGEVKVYNYSDYKERYEEIDYVYVGDKKTEIESVRYMKEMPIVKLKGANDRNAAEALKGKDLFIDETQLRELPEDTFYIRDLIGLDVKDTDGKKIGTLTDVIQNSAQDLYEVKLEGGKKTLIPAVGEFIVDISLEDKCITVNLIEGFLDL